MRISPALGFAMLTLAVAAPAPAQTYIWTGVGTGWQGQVTPPNDGTANLVLGWNVSSQLPFTGSFNANSLTFVNQDYFRINSSDGESAMTFTLNNGIDMSAFANTRLDFGPEVTVNVPSAQTWNLGYQGGVTIHGQLTGSGNLTVTGVNQTLLLTNLTSNFTDYSGNLTLANDPTAVAGSFPGLVLWGSNSLGTASITFSNGGNLITHQAPLVTNNIVFNSGPLLAGQTTYTPIRFRTWDGPATTISGNVTLANNTTFQANQGWVNHVDATLPNNTGSRFLPGPLSRYPVIFTGNIGESGGARSLNITGFGISILAGTNTYTGGTYVGFATGTSSSANGSLIFGTQAAIPATGALQVGLLNSSSSGYMGIATSAVPNAGDFNTFLNRITATSSGAVGLDSLDPVTFQPSSSPAVFADNINLTHFTTSANGGIRLGTATSVILTGTITPQLTSTYNFGSGGGKLYVQSNLVNLTTTTSVQNLGSGQGLQLYLQGNNTYTGATIANNGLIVFDGGSAMPNTTNSFILSGSATSVGTSYIGATELATGTTNLAGVSLTNYLGKFNKSGSWGILGFDTSGATPVTVSNLDLTGFNDGLYIGTSSTATITGSLNGTTVTNGSNAANAFRFTAAAGGTLTVDSTLANGGGPRSVIIGNETGLQKMGDGTVVLTGTNTYSGGTTLNAYGNITLAFANNSALGTGALTIGPQGGMAGLAAAAPGLVLPNDIIFSGVSGSSQLALTGSNDFTLAGNISGPPASVANTTGTGAVLLWNTSPINVTLSGNNSGFNGSFDVGNGTLTFASDQAAGQGTLSLTSNAATAAFTSANATIYGLAGDAGSTVQLSNGTHFTLNTDNTDIDNDFAGSIVGPAFTSTTADVTITGTGVNGTNFAYLHGYGNYTGGTNVTGSGALGIGTNDAIGTGTLTINSPNGGAVLNTGVTLTNPIVLMQGGLGGLGTFAPTSFNGTIGGPITIGAGQSVVPGIPGGSNVPAGTLTFAVDTVFQDGGSYSWSLQDPNRSDGYSLLAISGNLDLTSLSANGFLLSLETFDMAGAPGDAALTWGNSYSLNILTTTGTISGFDAANFVIDTSSFQGGLIAPSQFSLSMLNNNTLVLNFQAVPEPSTCVLLSIGLAAAGSAAWRRRRRAA